MVKLGPVRTVVVVAKEGHQEAEDVAEELTRLLVSAGFKTYPVTPLQPREGTPVASLRVAQAKHPDMVLAVGGDGTLLKTLRELDDETPVLGVNVGGRGILAEVPPNQINDAVQKLSVGAFFYDRRIRVVAQAEKRSFPPATNEIYLSRVPKTRTPTFRILAGSNLEVNQRMDGLLVATPTGSTGHTYSLGGPVVQESLDIFLLTPLAPVSRLPSLIVPPDPVHVTANQPINVVVDGQEVFAVDRGTPVLLKKYHKSAVFTRFSERGLRQLRNLGFQ